MYIAFLQNNSTHHQKTKAKLTPNKSNHRTEVSTMKNKIKYYLNNVLEGRNGSHACSMVGLLF